MTPPVQSASAAPVLGFAELGLPQPLVVALQRHGFDQPFPIQAATLPDVLARRDVLGRGATGSGKTLAFGLPTLARLSGRRAKTRQPLALVLVPTRELALQVNDALEPFAHAVGLRTKVVVGGLSIGKQIDALRRGVEVVIATPGRLTDLVERKACDLGAVDIVVLDEADHMADMGFLPAVSALLDTIPKSAQKLLFSATLDRDVDSLVRKYLVDPVTHATAPAVATISTMEHHFLLVDAHDKAMVTAEIANREGRTLAFVRTKHGADRLAKHLTRAGVSAGALHGGKTQSARNGTLLGFREGRIGILVATNVAARGLHVDGIDLVLHVDPPEDPKDYLHRAGRTARAGESGTVVTLVLPAQRREVEQMAKRAGVAWDIRRVSPGHHDLMRVTGSRKATGIPVTATDVEPRGRAATAPRSASRTSRTDGDDRKRRSGRTPRGGYAAGRTRQGGPASPASGRPRRPSTQRQAS